jgi:Tfp pilus tip-associated adhesin PilY1
LSTAAEPGRESDDDDLGDSFSRPVIAKLNDGDWYVITGNGYNSVNGVAMLYLVNLDTLELTKISTSSGTKPTPMACHHPACWTPIATALPITPMPGISTAICGNLT